MAKMECPICGRKFDEEDVDFLDNGNPACYHCVKEEQKSENVSNQKEENNK